MQALARKIFLTGGMTASLAGCGGGDGDIPVLLPEWFAPECTEVSGLPFATFSTDAGVTITPNTSPVEAGPEVLATGLAAASAHGGLLFATHFETTAAYLSTDAGCHWSEITTTPGGFQRLVATDRYGYAVGSSYDEIYRFAANGSITRHELPFRVQDLATTPADPVAVYALSRDNYRIYRSDDLGRTWIEQGIPPSFPNLPYYLFISPRDSLHFLVTGFRSEPAVSFDGGLTWTEATGIVKDGDYGGTHHAVFGDADQNEVWVSGVRNHEDSDGNLIRHDAIIFHSTDGGLSFDDAVLEGNEIFIGPATILAAPHGIFGEVVFTSMDGPFGQPARTYRYRASDDSVTIRYYEPEEACGFSELLFHPTDPDVLYMGRQDDIDCAP